jgi:hypothetical protein
MKFLEISRPNERKHHHYDDFFLVRSFDFVICFQRSGGTELHGLQRQQHSLQRHHRPRFPVQHSVEPLGGFGVAVVDEDAADPERPPPTLAVDDGGVSVDQQEIHATGKDCLLETTQVQRGHM